MGDAAKPRYPDLDERERQIDSKLGHAFGRTPEDIRAEVRRRALRIEADAIRRQR